jgi:hypothetical protein
MGKDNGTHEVFKVVFFMLALAVAMALFMLWAWSATAQEEPTAAEWEAWEKKAQQAGAGEEVPVPDDSMTPHQVWCSTIKGYCPTVVNGVIAGQQWCVGKAGGKVKPKCYTSHRNRSYKIMLDWWDWLSAYMGGKHPIYTAGTIRTESEGVWDAMTNSSTKECGLASIDLAKAESYDINACDAKANIWAAGQMTNQRLIKLREKYPQLVQAPLSDQWKLAGACGAIGSNKVHNLIDASGALRTRDDGSLYYQQPHERVLKWLMWKDKQDPAFFYSYEGTIYLGRNPGKGAFRVARSVAGEALLADIVGGADNLYSEPALVPRPEDLYPFPGKALHCKCYQWPELADRHPVPVASAPGVTDPAVLDAQ